MTDPARRVAYYVYTRLYDAVHDRVVPACLHLTYDGWYSLCGMEMYRATPDDPDTPPPLDVELCSDCDQAYEREDVR